MSQAPRIRPSNIHSLTDFQKNTKAMVAELEATGEPIVLTVNGKAKLVVQDASAYEESWKQQDRKELIAALREALAEDAAGQTQPLDEVMSELRKELEL